MDKNKKEHKPLFNPERIIDRVYGDHMGGTFSVNDAIYQYLFNEPGAVDKRIKGIEQYIKDHPEINNSNYRWSMTARKLSHIKQHEDAKRIYLGSDPKYGTMEKSPYRPTIGKAEDNTYQVIPLLTSEWFKNLIFPKYINWKYGDEDLRPIRKRNSKIKDFEKLPTIIDKGKTAQLLYIPYLNGATMSEGFDDRGQYISLYDRWDYNTKVAGKSGDNIAKWVGGKPFDIYQRYYLDDYLGIPEESKGNPYITPAVITATRDKDGGVIPLKRIK